MCSAIDYFKEISKIPRGSGNEKEIAEYIAEFAHSRGLFCIKDSLNNVYVRKPASEGYENVPSVLLAAHTDMVCEKLETSEHDFLHDGLELKEENGMISANGTTLGADDGAGVAVMLNLMDEKNLSAPETEYLFTSAEETGMYGALGFDYSYIMSERIINLDSESENCACIGCASGSRYEMKIPVERTRKSGKTIKITVNGLAGGHSGTDIDKDRRSAVILLGQLLNRIYGKYPFYLTEISGGGKDNVIPVSAQALADFYSPEDEKNAFAEAKMFEKEIKTVLGKKDAEKFSVSITKIKESENPGFSEMMTLKSTSAVISALILSPQGVTAKIPDTGLVDASVNLGILKTEDKCVTFEYLLRSGNKINSDDVSARLHRLSHVLGGSCNPLSSYPGWPYRRGSALQDLYTSACLEIFGREPEFTSVHAGLECGIFSEKLREIGKNPDIISIGPALYDIHSPKERLDAASLERLYKTVKKILGYIRI